MTTGMGVTAMPHDEGVDRIELAEVASAGIAVRVVAAKKPEHWIVRGIGTFKSQREVLDSVLAVVGQLDHEGIEWTTFEYRIPSYIAYPAGDMTGLADWPGGVFIHRYIGGGCYGEGRLP